MTDSFQARIARDLVVVEGPDATSFLQSLVSQDLDAVAVGASGHSLLLQPQGKLLVDFYVLHVEPDVWWCVCEGGFGEALASGLNRFKIRVKVDVREVPVAALALRGVEPPASVPADVRVFAVDWPAGSAFDAIGPEAAIDALERCRRRAADRRRRVRAGAHRSGCAASGFRHRRAHHPAGGRARTRRGVVHEGLLRRPGVGVPHRLARPRQSSPPAPACRATANVERGASVALDDREVGEVTSSTGAVALAMLRREVEPGATVRVGAVAAVVEAL